MSILEPAHLPSESVAASPSLAGLNDRLAEAACYAVLRRLMPVLRHDVAGAMQPVRMLMMVLERRLQAPEPDLPAITKNVTSLSSLTKQASADCISALEWIGSSQDMRVSLQSSVDEAIKLLAMELSATGLGLVNGVTDDSILISQSFFRCALMAALLAFCDQSAAAGTLQVTCEAAVGRQSSYLHMRMLPDDSANSPASLDIVRKYRLIDWPDVRAIARSLGVNLELGDGWLKLDLPED